jgi:hypothetical protein
MGDSEELGRDPETLRLYWRLQWDRNAQLEEQRLSVSNFVVAGSVVALGIFAATPAATGLTAWLLAIAVAVSNVLAAIYSNRSEQWARLHKARASKLLTENWGYLAELQKRVEIERPRPHNSTSPARRQNLQLWIHIVLALVAIGLAVVR